jgi:8-oxo-dGTP diphosphatase
VGELLGTAEIRPGFALHVYAATLRAGSPRPLEDHDELRWLASAELHDVPWLPADRPVLAAVRATL